MTPHRSSSVKTFDDQFARVRAAARAGDTEYLIATLRDKTVGGSPPIKLRAVAARYLGRVGDARAAPHLIRMLDDDDPYVRGVAVQALSRLRAEEAIPTLIRAVGDESLRVRKHALDGLRVLRAVTGERAAISALADASPMVTKAAVRVLAEVGGDAAADALRTARRAKPFSTQLRYRIAEWKAARRAQRDG